MATSSHNPIDQIENAAGRASEGVMYAGAAGSGVAWASSAQEVAAIAGMAIAFVGFCFTLFFSFRRDKRQRELHDLQIQLLRDKIDDE